MHLACMEHSSVISCRLFLIARHDITRQAALKTARHAVLLGTVASLFGSLPCISTHYVFNRMWRLLSAASGAGAAPAGLCAECIRQLPMQICPVACCRQFWAL
jgi:hypothetical protein